MEEKIIIPKADKIYTTLLSFYPIRYQKQYAQEMLYVFRDLYREELQKEGRLDGYFWLKIFTDVLSSSFSQHIQQVKQNGLKVYLKDLTMDKKSLFAFFIIAVLFLLPALADLAFTYPMLGSVFRVPNYPAPPFYELFPNIFITGMVMSVLLYAITFFHLLNRLFRSTNKFLRLCDHIYQRFKPYILISIALSISSYAILLPAALSINLLSFIGYSPESALFFKSIFLITILMLYLRRSHKVVITTGLIVSLVFACFAGFLLYVIYQESQPDYYYTFKLDDPKARYVINYDGDYWITMYDVKHVCEGSGPGQFCHEVITKIGNTSITEAPEPLEKYRDKAVIVTGEFVPKFGAIYGNNKKFCIKEGWKTTCKVSTGPGSWEASPLKIKTIRLE